MIRSFRLVLTSVLFCCAIGTAHATAPLAPEMVKNQVENSLQERSFFSSRPTTEHVAQEVLASDSLETLLAQYPLATILGWKQGKEFISQLQKHAQGNATKNLSTELQLHVQKQLLTTWGLATSWESEALTPKTPSTIHAFSDYETMYSITSDLNDHTLYQKDLKTIAPMISTMMRDEKALNEQGYYVFFHGQRWEYLIYEKFYTDLWAIINHKQRPTNYLFAHVRMKGFDPLEKYESLKRTDMLQAGANYFRFYDAILWTTNSLFSNYKIRRCSSPLLYFLKNKNFGKVTLSLKDIFAHYHLLDLYKKYAKEIAALETHFKAAQTYGTILRVAIPKSMIDDYCFVPVPGGPVSSVKASTLLEQLKNPSHALNNETFCISMLDKAMDPEGGILIKPYHCAKQAEYQQFGAGYEKLITTLQQEVAQSYYA